jgi:hypothetical protein
MKTLVMKVLAYLICLSGISSNALAEVSPELMRSSAVVVTQPEFSAIKLKVFSWADKHADISEGLKKSDFSVSALIDTAIKSALEKKAYTFEKSKKNSMLIMYHASLASEINDIALTLKYGLSPGLRGNSAEAKEHERGTLVVDIIDPQLKKVVWRGAVEVFTGIEDTKEGRQNRVNGLLVELFSSLASKK